MVSWKSLLKSKTKQPCKIKKALNASAFFNIKKTDIRLVTKIPINFDKKSQNKFYYFCNMKKHVFKILAKVNKIVFPSYSKKQLDLIKASKLQMAVIGWRWFVTKNALD